MSQEPGIPGDHSAYRGARSRLAFKLWDRILATVTALAVVGGGALALWRFLDQRNKDLDLRRKEYDLLIYKERRDMYHALCKSAGEIAGSKTYAEATPSIKSFLALNYGEINIILEPSVGSATDRFAEELQRFIANGDNYEDQGPSPELQQASIDLGKKCREVLKPEQYLRTGEKQTNP